MAYTAGMNDPVRTLNGLNRGSSGGMISPQNLGYAAAGAGTAGGLSGLFNGGGLFGKPAQQMQRFNPQQQSALNQLLSSGLMNSNFNSIENQARSNFNENTIPSIAERFTNLPGQGGQRSSAFQGALGRAGSGLEQNLAALKSQFGMNQLGLGLTPQLSDNFQQRQPGGVESGLSAIMQLLPLLAFL